MIRTGRMSKRIQILATQEVTTESGIKKKKTTVFRRCWAAVEPVSGKEQREANKINNKINYNVYIRYYEGIKPEMIIEYNGKKLEIHSVIDQMERHELLIIACSEVS